MAGPGQQGQRWFRVSTVGTASWAPGSTEGGGWGRFAEVVPRPQAQEDPGSKKSSSYCVRAEDRPEPSLPV